MAYLRDCFYFLLLIVCSPCLILRSIRTGKYRDGWAEKLLGSAPLRISDRPCVWFHAVSVGEVLLLKPLIGELSRRRPGWDIVVSTRTITGLAQARRTFPDLVTFYAPLDFSWAVRRAIARIRPTVLALVELELWPNLIEAAKRAGAAVAIINGRLSARSHRGYRRFRPVLRPTLDLIDVVAAQSQEYADRFVDLGVPTDRLRITGSVKYDGLEAVRDNPRTGALREAFGLSPLDVVFVAGSTMEGEEDAALAAYRAAKTRHRRLRLILVPRHQERFDEVARFLLDQGERLIRRSRPGAIFGEGADAPVVLVDSIGELKAVWGLADAAFVGGSLLPGRGGQNMIEPAAYGAPLLFGPHTHHFRDTVEHLLDLEAARVVKDANDLIRALGEDLDDPETAAERGAAAKAFVLAQHGASARTLAELDRLVGDATEPVCKRSLDSNRRKSA